jgi:enediyne biosynthesis protein E4
MKYLVLVFATTIMLLNPLLQKSVHGQGQSISPRASVVLQTQSLQSGRCGTGFREHQLSHTTMPRGGDRTVYDSNGSGVAVGDLDGNGFSDLVLGNLAGAVSVLWNQGDFGFESTTLINTFGLPESNTRAVAMVDINADMKLDIVVTHTSGSLAVWYNQGQRRFGQSTLEGVKFPAYTMLWEDFDLDNDLDLVTASYDALLEAEQKDTFMLGGGAGVVVYTNQAGVFHPNRLSNNAQSLALMMFDVDMDGRRDLVVGNDFAMPDQVWLNTKNGFVPNQPFGRITRNTMGFSSSDVDNNGTFELFATDMKPRFDDLATIAKWMPFIERTYQKLQYSNLQRAENVLQTWTGHGFVNRAYEQNIDATGWSWSAQFGDLDNDGFEDLYIVNGMIDKENLKYLKNNELVEQNQVYRNQAGVFQKQNTWKLESLASGRGMVFSDLNNDGRLDVVVNNLNSKAQIFENQICNQGMALEVSLDWKSKNTQGIGATLKLKTNFGTLQRQLHNQSGYLSGNDPKLHFGFPVGTNLEQLEVLWADGASSLVKDLSPNAHLLIRRKP